ncbi:MAG: hypothetical protein QG635_1676 [Bacteroidota bacterium]|nr:hypothetical protein [Bacteroidota bacterium]
MEDIRRQIYKNMTPEEKIRTAEELINSARELKFYYLKKKYPDCSEEELNQKLKNWFMYGRED